MDQETTTPETPEPTNEPAFDMEGAVDSIAESLGFAEEPEAGKDTPEAEPKSPAESKTGEPESPQGEGTDPTQAPDKAAFSSQEAPDTWTKEAKEEWAKLSPTVQSEIRKREDDIARFVADTKPKAQIGEGFEKLIQPYQQLFSQYKVNPWNHVSALLNAHTRLLFGSPQEKAHMAFALLKDAGIDPGKLTGPNPLDAIMPQNQELAMLRARIAELEGGVTSVTSELTAQRTAEREQQVASFAESPDHPHFYEVWQDMEQLLRSKVCKTLEDAYEKAVWGNPIVRAKEVARQNTEAQKRAEAARKTQLETSRRAAGVNIRGSSAASGAARANGNWEDTMTETLAEIRSRP